MITTVAYILLAALTIFCAVFYFLRAKKIEASSPVLMLFTGLTLFILLFFIQSWFLDNVYMPRWFYKLIVMYPDAAGAILVMLECAFLVIALSFVLLRKKKRT